jgi:amino acid adenylation domain-containing protein
MTATMLDAVERELVLHRFNDTTAPYPDGSTLDGLVAAQIARTPDGTAVEYEASRLSYRELDERAGRVARALRTAGVRPGDLVAVCAQRCLDLPAALLGVLRAGAAYVPLDPEYPATRLAFMLDDSGARVVLTQTALRDKVAGAAAVLLDDLSVAGAVDTMSTVDAVAYMIYTSGSTGQPKGALISHRAIVNRLDWMQKEYRLGPDDAVLQKTPTSFDVSVWEFFWPLTTGARLVLAKPGGHKDPGYLRELIIRTGVTTIHFVPSMLAVFLAEPDVGACRSLRRVICSGEALPAAHAQRCLATLPAELHNLYGPTEAAIDVTTWRCAPGDQTVPIGRPVQNTQIYLLDEARRPVPVGVPGELYIGGVQLAIGYHRRPELTTQRFIQHPELGRLYRTGDRARWRPDGAMKLRGQRIEPGEIEAALRDQPGVTDAAVLLREDRPGHQRLVGYLVGGDPAAAYAALEATLPEYLVPAALVPLDALPLTPNGKLDRAALPPPQPRTPPTGGSAEAPDPPRTPTERHLARAWADVLDLPVEEIGRDHHFFESGGTSLSMVRLGVALDRVVSLAELARYPILAQLAAVIDGRSGDRKGERG